MSTNRVTLGLRNDGSGTYGFDVSLAGFNVDSATQAQLSFSDKWLENACVHATGTVASGSTASWTALSYIPMVLAGLVVSTNFVEFGGFQQVTVTSVTQTEDWTRPRFTVTTSGLSCLSDPGASYTMRYVVLRAVAH